MALSSADLLQKPAVLKAVTIASNIHALTME
jgi:hypothetical protein